MTVEAGIRRASKTSALTPATKTSRRWPSSTDWLTSFDHAMDSHVQAASAAQPASAPSSRRVSSIAGASTSASAATHISPSAVQPQAVGK